MQTNYTQRKDLEGWEEKSEKLTRWACCDCGLVHDIVFVSQDGKPIGVSAKRNDEETKKRRES